MDRAQAAAAIGSIALLGTQDARIDAAVQRNRSSTTNSVARAVTPLGSYAGIGVSVASLGSGLLFRDTQLRDTGRDAIEAEVFAAGIVTPILKEAFGRTRPIQGSDADEYRPLSKGQSFPSGHSTEAFAAASVFAARSEGWVVPVVAYSLASGVALARMNDRAHFASDVVAGAVIGTAIGQSIVHRHAGEAGSRGSWKLVPLASVQGKGGIGVAFDSDRERDRAERARRDRGQQARVDFRGCLPARKRRAAPVPERAGPRRWRNLGIPMRRSSGCCWPPRRSRFSPEYFATGS